MIQVHMLEKKGMCVFTYVVYWDAFFLKQARPYRLLDIILCLLFATDNQFQ